jgi:uncharacterized protein (DUF302 family)
MSERWSNASVRYHVNRLSMYSDQPFDDFIAKYEAAVPNVDAAATRAFIDRGAPWDDVVAEVASLAVHGFLMYWKSDVTSVMQLAGDRQPCISYLMGNHTIAQRMFQHDAAVMLHAPLRTLVCADDNNRTRFVTDQPSALFNSFGSDAIATVGIELDRKLAALLEHLGVEAPSSLRTSP